MNHIYRVVWSEARNAWIAVAEITRGRGKTTRRKLIAAALSLSATAALAEPIGGQVIAGAGDINQSGVTTTITQSSQNLSINWQSFNIAAAETVNFAQPSTTAVAVNRILDPNGSQILGRINANGQVYLLNPNGILFGQGSQVNVGGLVASTLEMQGLDGNAQSFSGNGAGSVVNRGTINAADGGYVALLGHHVSNEGVISAHKGTVALGAGSAATLTFSGNSLVRMQVDESVLNNVAENGGLIRADGGMVVMTAGARDALLASVVNNTGVIEARTVENRDGTIVLMGGMIAGTVNVDGTLDASAPAGGNGGFIETSAAHVKVADTTRVTTAATLGLVGTWLIDPIDFTIAPTGGDITGAAVSAGLGSTSMEFQSTTGNVIVNDVVSWSAHELTLNAFDNIIINAQMDASGTATLALKYGQGAVAASNLSEVFVHAPVNLPAGPSFSTLLGSDGVIKTFTVITTLGIEASMTATDLQGMNGAAGANYALGASIDANATAGWNANSGFLPIAAFTGTFDGLGHTISGLTIDRPGTSSVGLFANTSGSAAIRNVGLVGGSIRGAAGTGGLVGSNGADVAISNSFNTGSVVGAAGTGGLVGDNTTGAISSSYTTGTVTGAAGTGGLIGSNTLGAVSNTYATGNVVSSGAGTGGLIGSSTSGLITNSYSTGGVTSPGAGVGGLVGAADVGVVSDSFWNTETSGQVSSSGGGTGLTTVQMRTTADLAGFNFTTTPGAPGNNWVIVDVDGSLNNLGAAAGATYPMLASEYSTTITNAHQLQLMTMAPAATYTLGNGINAEATGNSTDVWGSGGFVPVGNTGTKFTGRLEGRGRAIASLTINRPAMDDVGLFGFADSAAQIRDLAMLNVSVTGNDYVGGLVGRNLGAVDNTNITGTVNARRYVGGLAGYGYGGSISNSNSSVAVTGSDGQVGGLVGYTRDTVLDTIHATGNVSGTGSVGGLVGEQTRGTISNSSASGTVIGTGDDVGGLVGNSQEGPIDNSTAAGAVNGANRVGGLVGNSYYSDISNSTATGNVTAVAYAGGLVGNTYGSIDGSHATGSVTGVDRIGGLVGYVSEEAIISNSDAIGSVSGNTNVGGLVGYNVDGAITTSTASGNVSALIGVSSAFGGLVGHNSGAVSDSSASGTVSGPEEVGGLVGYNNGPITGSSATGDVGDPAVGTKVGGLVGNNDGPGTIDTSFATGNVDSGLSGNTTGGLAGNNDGTITSSRASGTVSSGAYSGGLVGVNDGAISSSHAIGDVSGITQIGGLSGTNTGAISNSYATGDVAATGQMSGGLLGIQSFGTISTSYATGDVNGANHAGGLAGYLYGGSVNNSYATGSVTGTDHVGGLAGLVDQATIDNSYASGLASGTTDVGGFVGLHVSGAVSDSFWDTINPIGMNGDTTGATGLSSAEMQTRANFTSATLANGNVDPAWDFASTWILYEGHTTPLLRYFMTPITATVDSTTRTYDGIAFSGGTAVNFSTVPDGRLLNAAGFTGDSQGARNAGSYVIASDAYSNQQGYAITFVNGTLTVDPALLALSTSSVTKVYDGGLTAVGTAVITSGTLFSTDSISGGSFAFADKNVGTGKTVTVAGVTVNDGNSGGNYTVSYGSNTASVITAANLTLSTSDVTKVYDGGLTALGTAAVTSGTLFSTDSLAGGNFAFTDKNAGTGKTVTVAGVTVNDGNSGGNYNVSYANNTASVITAANLILSTSDVTKVYDGGLTALGTAAVTSGTLFSTDTISGGSFAFTNKDAGTGKTVTTTGVTVNDGNSGGNYNVSYANNTASVITAANVAVTGVTAANRVYDGTTSAGLGGNAAVSAFGSDSVNVGGTGIGTFDNRNAGIGKAITVSGFTLTGADAGNYVIAQPSGLMADITAANLTLSSSNVTRVYNGGVAAAGTATVTGGTLFSPDTISGGSFAFTNKDAGTGKTVTTTGVTVNDGNSGGNYNVSYANNTASVITAANLAVTGVTAANRVYDGTTSAALGGNAAVNAIGADQVSVGGTGVGTFASRNAGTGRAITVSGFTLSGTDAGNYVIAQPSGLMADITAANLTLSSSNVTRVYNGGVAAAGTATVSGGTLVAGDTIAGGNFAFTNKNAGGGKTVTTTGVTVNDGNSGGNYNVTYANNTTSTITAANLAVAGISADDKIYDGTTAATLRGTGTVSAIGTDVVNLGGVGVGVFDDQNVGVDKAISVTGLTISGVDAGNYNLAQPSGLTADITASQPPPQSPQSPPHVLLDGVAQLESDVLKSSPDTVPDAPDLAAATEETESCTGGVSRDEASGDCPVVMIGGLRGPRLRIVDGGMRMPSNMVQGESR